MRKKINFIKFIWTWGIVFLIGFGASIISVNIISSYRNFNFQADQLRSNYITHQKQTIKQEVTRVADLISYERTQGEILTKKKIKSRIYEAYAIAQNIYQLNRAAKTETEIQQMIIDALSPIRFAQESGYYFITRLDGIEILFADRPEMEGLTLLNVQDTKGKYVVKDMIEIAEQFGEGFYEYHWTKPDAKRNDFKKISFVKRFEPYDWIIGTGLYVADVENQIKADLLLTISRIRFGKEGYIFINRLNGDALISNGKRFPGTEKLWEVFNDNPEKAKDIFEKEYKAALKPDGDYIYYTWEKLTDSNKESPKTSFIYGIPDLQWLVGAGVYLDDVETDIALMRTQLNNQVKSNILYSILIIIGITAVFFLFFNWLNLRLKNDFKLFFSFFSRAAYSDEKIDRENIKFIELDQIAEPANKMLMDRRQAMEALLKSEEKYRALFEYNPVDTIFVDNAGKIIMYNLVKKKSGEKLPRIGGILYRDYAVKHQINMFEELMKCIRTGEQKEFPELKYKKRFLHIRISPFSDGAIITSIDLTEIKTLQRQFAQAQKMESVGRLAGGVAHDYNNMLSVILGYTELAMNDMDPTGQVYANLNEVFKAARRATDITRQLLTFARKQTIAPKVLDLNENVESTLKMLRRLIGENIDLAWLPGPSLWPVKMDPSQIDQVLANLCINARDAISGVGKVTIETSTKVFDTAYCADHAGFIPGEFILLAVSDNGCGIDKELLNNIFEPFFTTKDVNKGTGLGLSTVYGIIKQNNGFINAYSEPGKGMTMKIYLPRHEGTVVKIQEKNTAKIPQGHGEMILLVEDDLPILELTEKILNGLGYTVLAANTPGKAMDLAREHTSRIHLLITDVIMPEMNGRELAEQLKSICPDLKCMFMSGYTANAIAHHGVLDEGVHFIQKPFSQMDIAQTVRKVLNK